MTDEAAKLVAKFRLQPHPEGGYFREVYRSAITVEHPSIPAGEGPLRAGGSLIYFLLGRGDFSAFHRVRWTDEIWHLYAGGPLELHVLSPDGVRTAHLLNTNMEHGEPTHIVPAGHFQAARLGPETEWAFGGCTVAPGFDFADFEMPPRSDLLDRFSEHAQLIHELTRP